MLNLQVKLVSIIGNSFY